MKKYKKKVKKFHTEAKKKRTMLWLIAGAGACVLLLLCCVLFIGTELFFSDKKQENGQTGESVSLGVSLVPTETPPENQSAVVTPEPTPLPEEVVSAVPMGEDVTYLLYTDGTLKVTGTGATRDFASMQEFTDYFMQELSAMHLRDLQDKWFYAVTDIVIEDGITRLGDFSLAMYLYAEKVTCHAGLISIGENSFRGCGLKVPYGAEWDMDFTDISVADGAFNVCLYPPVECKPTYLPEELEEMEQGNGQTDPTETTTQ